jgi:hypothetical protein
VLLLQGGNTSAATAAATRRRLLLLLKVISVGNCVFKIVELSELVTFVKSMILSTIMEEFGRVREQGLREMRKGLGDFQDV